MINQGKHASRKRLAASAKLPRKGITPGAAVDSRIGPAIDYDIGRVHTERATCGAARPRSQHRYAPIERVWQFINARPTKAPCAYAPQISYAATVFSRFRAV
jgi:hypothetical protein